MRPQDDAPGLDGHCQIVDPDLIRRIESGFTKARQIFGPQGRAAHDVPRPIVRKMDQFGEYCLRI